VAAFLEKRAAQFTGREGNGIAAVGGESPVWNPPHAFDAR
jgi:hypothetical protein